MLRRTADDDDPVERVIVANADQLVVVTALADPEPRPRLIDRALVAAFDAGMAPLLVPHQGRPRRPRDAAVDLPLPRRAVGGDRARRRPRRGARPRCAAGPACWSATRASASRRWSTRWCPRPTGTSAIVNAVTGRGRHTSTSAFMLALPGRRRLDHRHPGHPVVRPGPRPAGGPDRRVPRPRRDDRGLPPRLHPRRRRARVRPRRGRRRGRGRPRPGRVVPAAPRCARGARTTADPGTAQTRRAQPQTARAPESPARNTSTSSADRADDDQHHRDPADDALGRRGHPRPEARADGPPSAQAASTASTTKREGPVRSSSPHSSCVSTSGCQLGPRRRGATAPPWWRRRAVTATTRASATSGQRSSQRHRGHEGVGQPGQAGERAEDDDGVHDQGVQRQTVDLHGRHRRARRWQ